MLLIMFLWQQTSGFIFLFNITCFPFLGNYGAGFFKDVLSHLMGMYNYLFWNVLSE